MACLIYSAADLVQSVKHKFKPYLHAFSGDPVDEEDFIVAVLVERLHMIFVIPQSEYVIAKFNTYRRFIDQLPVGVAATADELLHKRFIDINRTDLRDLILVNYDYDGFDLFLYFE